MSTQEFPQKSGNRINIESISSLELDAIIQNQVRKRIASTVIANSDFIKDKYKRIAAQSSGTYRSEKFIISIFAACEIVVRHGFEQLASFAPSVGGIEWDDSAGGFCLIGDTQGIAIETLIFNALLQTKEDPDSQFGVSVTGFTDYGDILLEVINESISRTVPSSSGSLLNQPSLPHEVRKSIHSAYLEIKEDNIGFLRKNMVMYQAALSARWASEKSLEYPEIFSLVAPCFMELLETDGD